MERQRIREGWEFVQSHTMRYIGQAETETQAPDGSVGPSPFHSDWDALLMGSDRHRRGLGSGRAWTPSQCLPSAVSPPGGLPCLFRRKNHLIKNRNSLPGTDPRIIFGGQVTLINFFNVMKLTLPLSIWEYSHDVEMPKPERSS